jgi:hypothetical protein
MFSDQQKVHYIDEGDLLVGKGRMWGDTFHLNTSGAAIVAKTLIYDLIVMGYLENPDMEAEKANSSSVTMVRGAAR